MAGIFVAKLLAVGNVDDAAMSALYTAPALTTTYLKNVRFFNDNASVQTMVVAIERSGTTRKYGRVVLNQNEFADEWEDVALSAGDIIKAQTTTNAAVRFHVFGVEET